MAKRKHPERDIQKAILGFIKTQYPKAVVFHIPNGGSRNVLEAINLKNIGVRSGVADLCLLWRGGHVGFLEVKAATGSLSENQLTFMDDCVRLGVAWECVKSIDETKAALKLWGVA